MSLILSLEIDDYDEYLALECLANLEDAKHILYRNHAGNGYLELPVKKAIITRGRNDI